MITDGNKKTRKKNFRASTENISSKATTNTVSDSGADKSNAMKGSSTHEFIKDLPDLEEGKKINDEPEKNEEEKEQANSKVREYFAHVTVIDLC